MGDFSGILDVVKQAGKNATNAEYPVAVMFGTVTSVSPLEIEIEQKMTLDKARLILSRNVTDHTVEMTGNYTTENDFDVGMHRHAISGKKSHLVHNGLKIYDEVILLRVQGGQRFIVLDRLE